MTQLITNQKNYYVGSLIFSLAIILLSMYSCKKEKTVDTNSPAYKIEQSEKLIIPAEVDLPVNHPHGNTRIATYYAKGVQQYKAQLKTGSTNEYEWAFVAPNAELFDAANNKIGTHSAGPVWVVAAAGSITAQQFTPAKTVTTDANSISWLLLKPKDGTTPTGLFADVDYIQRIATTGGKAPAIAPTNSSETADVFYTAIYRFSKRNP